MANFFPLIVNVAQAQIQEIPVGDFLDLSDSGIANSGNITVTGVISATGNISGGNLSGTSIVGTLTTAAQTNITSLGTLTSLSVTGNVAGGNLTTAGLVSAGTTITATGNITGGNVTTAGQVTATGNVSGGNLLLTGNIFDSGTSLQINTTTAANISLAPNATIVLVATTTGANITGTLNATGNANVGNMGTAGLITATGNITGGNLITAGLVSLASITKTGSNGVGNIGSSTSVFNTVFAKATSAQYADVAEIYQSDHPYIPGTVMEIGGTAEVTHSVSMASSKIAGVVSTKPAFLMNSGAVGDITVEVALLGRIPCRVIGSIQRGDLLCSSDVPGVATSLPADRYVLGCVIGKALENYHSDQEGCIEILVGRI